MNNNIVFSEFLNSFEALQLTLHHQIETTLSNSELASGPRSILRFLSQHQEISVPEIARIRHVSRQHVQVQINVLYEKGLVEVLENPNHARSFLYRLTKNGKKNLAAIQSKLDILANHKLPNQEELSLAIHYLEQIRHRLESN